MNPRCYQCAAVMLLTISVLPSRAVGQSRPVSQEDFYQPVPHAGQQDVSNRESQFQPGATAKSDFVPTQGSSGSSAVSSSPAALAQAATTAPSATGGSSDTNPGPIRPYNPQTPLASALPPSGQAAPADSVESGSMLPALGTTTWGQEPAVAALTGEPANAILNAAPAPVQVAPRHIFFRYDALYGVLSASNSGPIGSASAAGVFTSNGIDFPFFNSLSDDVFGSPTEIGNRFEFGEVGDDGGWMIGIFDWDQSSTALAPGGTLQLNDPIGVLLGYQDANSDDLDDDLDGDHIFGRDGIDLGTPDPGVPGGFLPIYDGVIDAPAPDDTDDLVTWVPVFSSLSGTLHTDITGIELMRYWRRVPASGRLGFNGRLMGGIRFIEFDEELNLRATGSFFDETSIRSSIENSVIGPQIGSEYSRCFGPWQVGATLRFLLGINFQGGKQTGSYATNAASQTGTVNQPLNLSPGAFSNVEHDTAFSPVFEWRLDSAYHFGPHASARVGYTGILFGGISRATESIDYSLPTFGLALRDDAVVFNALTFGFDVVF